MKNLNSEAAGTEWIRKAAREIIDSLVMGCTIAGLPTNHSYRAKVEEALAEVIARNVQPSPELGLCENFDAGSRHAVPHVAGACFNWKPIEARPVPQPATEPGEGLIARAKNLIDEIDDVARAHDSYEYGLPRGNDEILTKVLAALALRDVTQGADEEAKLAQFLTDELGWLNGWGVSQERWPEIMREAAKKYLVPVSSEKEK